MNRPSKLTLIFLGILIVSVMVFRVVAYSLFDLHTSDWIIIVYSYTSIGTVLGFGGLFYSLFRKETQ